MSAVPRVGAHPVRGVALILLAVLCFACLDTTAGWLGHRHPLLLMLWVRYGVQSMVMGLWVVVWAQRRRVQLPFRTEHPKFQATRGLLLLFSSAMTFLGATHMPVPEMTAINMLGPVLATVAAATLLGERVSTLRRVLLLAGFAGAIIVIRPGSGLFGWVVLFPLANTLSYTFFQLLTSRLSATENAYVTNFYTGLTGTALLTPIVIAMGLDLQGLLMDAPARDLLLLLALGLLGTGGHLLLILAFEQASASALVPFTYLQIGAAALVAYLAFGHVPDGWAWVGMAIIAASGAVNAWLNMRAVRQPVPPVQADTVAE